MQILHTTVRTMAIDYEALKELQQVLDDRYVLQSNCNEKQEAVNNKFSKDDKRIEILMHDFKVIKWLITTVAVSGIGTLVASFLGLILK